MVTKSSGEELHNRLLQCGLYNEQGQCLMFADGYFRDRGQFFCVSDFVRSPEAAYQSARLRIERSPEFAVLGVLECKVDGTGRLHCLLNVN